MCVCVCESLGVKVIMVTGDHPLTAAAIARQVAHSHTHTHTYTHTHTQIGIITEFTKDQFAEAHDIPEDQVCHTHRHTHTHTRTRR